MNMKNSCEKKCCEMSSCMSDKMDMGLLVLRLTTGIIFLFMGITKLQGMDATIAFFASVGIPAFLAWIVALLETIGGASLVLGFMTRIFSKILALIVLFAILIVNSHGPFMGMVMPLAVFGSAFALSCLGGGKYALCGFCLCGGKCSRCKNKHRVAVCSRSGWCGNAMEGSTCTEKCTGGVCSHHEHKDSASCDMCVAGTCTMHTEKNDSDGNSGEANTSEMHTGK